MSTAISLNGTNYRSKSDAARALLGQGLSIQEVAKQTGLTYQAVWTVRNKSPEQEILKPAKKERAEESETRSNRRKVSTRTGEIAIDMTRNYRALPKRPKKVLFIY